MDFRHDWQREEITHAIHNWVEQQALVAEMPKVPDLKKKRWRDIRRHAEALAELLRDDPAPLLERPLFSDQGEGCIDQNRLHAELRIVAGRARGLIASKKHKETDTPKHTTNVALAREAVSIFYRAGGTVRVDYDKGVGYYGALVDFTCEMFTTAATVAMCDPPKRGGIAKVLQKALREEKRRGLLFPPMEKK